MSNDYPPDWDSRRKYVYDRDEYQCQNCGRQSNSTNNLSLHAHHIVPKSKGGTHKISNLVSVCEDCHNAIHYDKQAPTRQEVTDHKRSWELFKKFTSDSETLMKQVQGNVIVESPGRFKHKTIEQNRVTLIQTLGQLTIKYNAPTQEGQQKMNCMFQSGIKFLRSPEDAWKKADQRNLTDQELESFVQDIINTRIREFGDSIGEITKIINSGEVNKIFNMS